MDGANIFVMYANGQGNVTVSPRLGKGHFEPQHDTTANLTLLQGSGVHGYRMVANILCSDCYSWPGGSMDFASNGSWWLWAAHAGLPLDTSDVQASLQQHQVYGSFFWNIAAAQGGQDGVNPFLGNSAANVTYDIVGRPVPVKVWHPNDSIPIAHSVLASTAFLVLFPIGAIVMRVTELHRLVWLHAGVQIASYAVLFAAFGMGLHVATTGQLFHNKHPCIGIALVIIMFFQAVDGLLHHRQFKKTQKRTVLTHIHIWTGRIAVVIGMVNGGFGMELAGVTSVGKHAGYGLVAAISATAYLSAVVYESRQGPLRPRNEKLSEPAAGHVLGSMGGD
ncbi:hypothetical protein ES702_02659 [subsurface metagenome]